MAKRHLKLVTPTIVNRTVTPRRPPNRDLRTLTEAEVERLMKAATRNRWGHRDSTMVVVAYRHGLRAAELVDLRWNQIEFKTANLHAETKWHLYAAHLASSRCRRRCGSVAVLPQSQA